MIVIFIDIIIIINCDCEKDGYNEFIYIKNDKEVIRIEIVVKIVVVIVRVKNIEIDKVSNIDS